MDVVSFMIFSTALVIFTNARYLCYFHKKGRKKETCSVLLIRISPAMR